MKDNFSIQAQAYAKHRPVYPQSLFSHILDFVPEKKLAWDCGTGNGQTAKELSKYFDRVYATDISKSQIENAIKLQNITYATEPAEQTNLPDNSVDLVTVSQALHWFNFDAFYKEVKRVTKQNGLLAAWTYSLLKIDPVTDQIIDHYHFETLEKYWDEERKYVDDGYINIPFPFKQISSQQFVIETAWDLNDLEGYFNTWSALQKYISVHNQNPVPDLMNKIKVNWLSGETRKITFPVHLKMGYVHG